MSELSPDEILSPRKIGRTDAVTALWPHEGPYTAQRATEAAAAIVHLWQYLDRVTEDPGAEALAQPADVSAALLKFTTSFAAARKVLTQLQGWADRLSRVPDLRHVDHHRSRHAAEYAAVMAADELHCAARQLVGVSGKTGKAADFLSRIENTTPTTLSKEN
ncbi:hypothetical protein ACWDYH_15240 [Nocardia goodfellowii]